MKPSDFLLSLMDLLGIVLPGMVATWLLVQYLPKDLQASFQIGRAEQDALPWFLYLFTSYGLGHFVFMGGSKLDPVYDRWRRHTKPVEEESTYDAATSLRKRLTPELPCRDFSTFKWARSYVAIHSPAIRLELERLEAESKFFRSIVVLAIVLILHFLVLEQNLTAAGALTLVCVLSFSRFCDQRWKLTELAYAGAVIVAATKTSQPESESTPTKAN